TNSRRTGQNCSRSFWEIRCRGRLLIFFGFWRRREPTEDFFELRWNRHVGVCCDKPLARRLREARIFLSELLIILLVSRGANYILELVLKAPDMNVVPLIGK